jgi:chemotaxis protein CheZ
MPDTPRYARGQVIDIINSVIDKMDTGKDVTREVFLHLSELAQIIDSLKKDISSVKPGHVKNSHIPDATDELGAVVTATAEATNKIMNICEEIESIADSVEGAPSEEIKNRVTQIYEACGFQDITGQRIRNVVSTLQVIEQKIDKIMETLSNTVGLKISDDKHEKVISIDDEKSLLNGPQMLDKAITQDDIDKLLADFDKP